MTFKHLATVVEMVGWFSLDGGGGDKATVIIGCKGLEGLRGGTAGGWPMIGKT